MVYHETCSCGNKVTITTSESGFKADGENKSYIVKCSKCHEDVRTISSGSQPIVSGGYAERET